MCCVRLWSSYRSKVVADFLSVVFAYVIFLVFSGCSYPRDEWAPGNVRAVNHTSNSINWMSVNGYGFDGGGGSSCCISLPTQWRPGLSVDVEWEIDPDRFVKSPPLGTAEFKDFMVKHRSAYRRFRAVAIIPEWYGVESCGLQVHFFICGRVEVTTSCMGSDHPDAPFKEGYGMKEPDVCKK